MIIVNDPGVAYEGCIPQETTINNVKLAHAYVPIQKFCKTYAPLTGLTKGTIFPALSGLYDVYWKKMREMDDE